jgi:hypothetical protein
MCKAKRMVRYVKAIIERDKHLTNIDVCHTVSRLQPDFDEVTWDFVQTVRTFTYKHLSEETLISELLERRLISEIDLHLKIRRRNKNA